jgi:ADP-ribosylglycohydrolase
MKIVPVTCLYAGKPELQEKVTEAIKVHQNNAKAIAFGITASRILEAVLLGAPLGQALDTCLENIDIDHAEQREAVVAAFGRGKAEAGAMTHATLNDLLLQLSHEAMKDSPDSPFYNFAARSCALPGSFTGPIYQLYKASADTTTTLPADAYLAAIRENILAAGDTCSRSVFVGAVLAAASSSESATSPPQALMDKVDAATLTKIDSAARAIADFVESSSSSIGGAHIS